MAGVPAEMPRCSSGRAALPTLTRRRPVFRRLGSQVGPRKENLRKLEDLCLPRLVGREHSPPAGVPPMTFLRARKKEPERPTAR
jgi:hypothetical protein